MLLLALYFSIPLRAHCWAAPGHLVTAALAARHLSADVQASVSADLAAYAAFSDAPSDFTRCAIWADQLKGSTHAFDSWHYIDTPIAVVAAEFAPPASCPSTVHVVWALEAAAASLRSNHSDAWSRGFMLRVLIHLMGDVHQPLHTACLLSPAFPASGDKGGNSVKLEPPVHIGHVVATELHAFWDAGCGDSGLESIRGEGSNCNAADVAALAAALDSSDVARIANTPLDGTSAMSAAFHDWADESHAIARNTSYSAAAMTDLGVGSVLHTGHAYWAGYTATASRSARQRLTLGGARLAQVVNTLYRAHAAAFSYD
jgi:S1/P1 Nuclease